MQPTQQLADALFVAKVRAARAMSPEEKLLAGPRLFDFACQVAADGIRAQHPDWPHDQVQREVKRRVELGRRLEGRL